MSSPKVKELGCKEVALGYFLLVLQEVAGSGFGLVATMSKLMTRACGDASEVNLALLAILCNH